MSRVLNINMGLLGHIDSGKTSLAKVLSTEASTAAFDKNPYSKEHGITLDLGFSAFYVDVDRVPEPLATHLRAAGIGGVQFALVDCPGHATLIRTIIGGAQIIDLMVLVVDVTKGIQTQTAECLVVGDVTTEHMLVALNKADLLPEKGKERALARVQKQVARGLAETHFSETKMLLVSANPGPEKEVQGIAELVDALLAELPKLAKVQRLVGGKADDAEDFLFAVDHCFALSGKGTVLTGTVLNGSLRPNDMVEIPGTGVTKQVKSIQMFKKPVQLATKGDRIGVLVKQFQAASMERGLVATPGTVKVVSAAVVAVEKIKFFKFPCVTKGKFHVTVGHATVIGVAEFFSMESGPREKLAPGVDIKQLPWQSFDEEQEYLYQEELAPTSKEFPRGCQFMLVRFETPIPCPAGSLLIGSRLDTDIKKEKYANTCRLAFHGKMLQFIDAENPDELRQLRVYKTKERTGVLDRVNDATSGIGRGMFNKNSDISIFVRLKVSLCSASGEVEADSPVGVIGGSFGKSGKFKVQFPDGGLTKEHQNRPLSLRFKRYVYDKNLRLEQ